MTLRLAASNIAWDAADDGRAAMILSDAGCAAVELAPTQWRRDALSASSEDVAAYRAWWESRGFHIIALQALLFGRPELQLFGDSESRRALIEHLDRAMVFGARVGARALVFGSPRNRARNGLSMADAISQAAEVFRELGDRAQLAGVTLCIEPNPPEYGCDFITTITEAVELCAATSHAHIGVQVDVGAMTMAGERYDNAMAIARPYIGHVHISEPHLAEVGAGSTDHGAVAVALRHIGYGGWVSIEMRKAGLHALERAARFASDAYLGGGSVPTDEAGAPRMS